MLENKRVQLPVEFKEGAEPGSVRAVFSVFDVLDLDRDIVRRSAFAASEGKEVALCWSHDWARPVGKGVIRTEADRAIFDGRFFLAAPDAQNAYEVTKGLGNIAEFSWGFKIPDGGANVIDVDGEKVREIVKAEVFEVSCVLKGAGIGTHLEALKEHHPSTYADQAEALVTGVKAFIERSEAAAAARAKEGRPIGAANRARIRAVLEALSAMTELRADLEALIAESEPPPKADPGLALLAEFETIQTRLQTGGFFLERQP